MTTYQEIEDAQADLEERQKAFLIQWGWRETSNTPGSYWVWVRDFSDVDAKRKVWDDEHKAGEPGRPSKSPPYGVVMADTDLALKMTAGCPWLNSGNQPEEELE